MPVKKNLKFSQPYTHNPIFYRTVSQKINKLGSSKTFVCEKKLHQCHFSWLKSSNLFDSSLFYVILKIELGSKLLKESNFGKCHGNHQSKFKTKGQESKEE